MKAAWHLRIEPVKIAPGQEWSEPTDAWRFLCLGKGAAYWLDGIRPRAFNEGELLVLAPQAKGAIRASQLNEVVLYGFTFAPALLSGFFTLAEQHFFQIDAARMVEPVRFLPSTHPQARKMTELSSRHASAGDLMERGQLLELIIALFTEALARVPRPATRDISAQNRFQQLIAQMPDIELVHHTPEELANLCGCSSRHFNRLFREHFGESPRARQTELRLLKASQLLRSTDEKVIQIALDSGYRSLSLFNSLFKRRFGTSPSQWRRRLNGSGKRAESRK